MNIDMELKDAVNKYQNDMLQTTKINYLQNPVFRKHPSKFKSYSQVKFKNFPLKSYNSQNYTRQHAQNIFKIKQIKNISLQDKNKKELIQICKKINKIQFESRKTSNFINPQINIENRTKNQSPHLINSSVPKFRSVIKPKYSKYKVVQADENFYGHKQTLNPRSFHNEENSQNPYQTMYQGFNTQRHQPDSQSLLRKNSLFLLNFIKTKYKNMNKSPILGEGFAGLIQKSQIVTFEQKALNRDRINFQKRQEYTQRVQKTIEQDKRLSEYHNRMKNKKAYHQAHNHIFPEPW